jgi:hypothetical protein
LGWIGHPPEGHESDTGEARNRNSKTGNLLTKQQLSDNSRKNQQCESRGGFSHCSKIRTFFIGPTLEAVPMEEPSTASEGNTSARPSVSIQ